MNLQEIGWQGRYWSNLLKTYVHTANAYKTTHLEVHFICLYIYIYIYIYEQIYCIFETSSIICFMFSQNAVYFIILPFSAQ